MSDLFRRMENPLSPRGIVLTGLAHYGPVLLVAKMMLLVGTRREPTSDITLNGPLRSRHAALICDEEPTPDLARDSDVAGRRRGAAGLGDTRRPELRWSVLPFSGAEVVVNDRRAPAGVLQRLADGDRLTFGLTSIEWRFRHPDKCDSMAVLEQSVTSPALARIDDATAASTIVIGRGELRIGRDSRRNHLVHRSLPCDQLRICQENEGWRVSSDERESCVFVNDDALCDHMSPSLPLPLHIQISADGPQLIEMALNGIDSLQEVHLHLNALS